jgi:adenylate cyclase, class 2
MTPDCDTRTRSMAVETEAKIRVDSHEPVRRRLMQLEAALLGEYDETNLFFDTAPPRLFPQDAGLRLRTSRDRRTGDSTHRLTYKGPRQPAQLKQREEIELSIDDPAAAGEMLQRLGFQVTLRFEKLRQSWRLGDCRIELDTLAPLGHFVEIEAPETSQVLEALDLLGMTDRPIITDSYPALLSALPQSGQGGPG